MHQVTLKQVDADRLSVESVNWLMSGVRWWLTSGPRWLVEAAAEDKDLLSRKLVSVGW